MSTPSPKPPLKLTHAQRLHGKTTIDTLYKTGHRRTAHPLTLHAARREDNKASAIGISIGKRCGNAVIRNLIKRRLREAFRHIQQTIPPGIDFLIVVKPHKPLELPAYQQRLTQLMLTPIPTPASPPRKNDDSTPSN